ncbi:MAG: alpha/beta hydrolase [Rhodobacteraceae bacterium]|jgi:pimeloyl-ACP methyl ester carboxylesterase|uniref:Palmitoyl-protein thioesterase ABHD10, mitochondrial n=1 Tax=Salipiger profundus TaxID=1229727 RepID=A0A1U7CZX5_9RHOB|nr:MULTISPECIES: alpha/beta hydrolase [Salipiger]APX21376.1 putative hydrolase or acyltransferase of alpha/beta superfamily [Salipiger profundus]MAB08786.1 alpha/beta hydrolase [Paracoccaceae bacterium]GGA02815.1 alpha/beta hydrolase [Salipiger profundus]SFC23470.1 Pimeloyl-ACP methyl ester carboxylesterase [Salipiger profundus]
MAETAFIDGPNARLAYAHTAGEGPTVVFLSGYKSDMEGTKAVHLEAWAEARGRAFLRLDYSGHGQSSGLFEAGCIGDWAADAQAVIEAVTEGPLILVGSSMGGWIATLLTKRLGARVAGFVGIAAAPDFTEDGFWAGFSEEERTRVMEEGVTYLPSAYGDPYAVTRRLIEDGRENLVLRTPLPMAFPVRLLQGTEDEAVRRETALALFDHIDGPDVRLSFVKGTDHRFSEPRDLAMIETAIVEVGG